MKFALCFVKALWKTKTSSYLVKLSWEKFLRINSTIFPDKEKYFRGNSAVICCLVTLLFCCLLAVIFFGPYLLMGCPPLAGNSSEKSSYILVSNIHLWTLAWDCFNCLIRLTVLNCPIRARGTEWCLIRI